MNVALRVRMLNTTFSSVIDSQQRTSLFQAIRKFQPVDIRLLLHGSPDLPYDDNVELFSHVQQFIKDKKSFLINVNLIYIL